MGELRILNKTFPGPHTSASDAGKTYYYQVRAKDQAGNVSAWKDGSFKVSDVTAPTLSGIAVAQGEKDYSFTVTAKASDNVTAEKDIALSFRYAESKEALANAKAGSLTFTVTASDAGKTLYYQVGAKDKDGNETWSAVQSVTVKDVTAPEIRKVDLVQEDGKYTFAMTAEAADNVKDAKFSYKIRYAETQEGVANGKTVNGNKLTLDSKGADAGKTIYYQVSVSDAAGNESWSAIQSVTVKDVTAPVIKSVEMLQTEGSYDFAASVTAEDNVKEGKITYLLRHAESREALEQAGAGSLNFTLTAADAGKTMYYQLLAKDEAGNETWSDVKSFTVADFTAPEIQNLSILQGKADYVFDVLAEVTDNLTAADKLTYVVKVAENENALGSAEVIRGTQFTLTSADAAQNFVYQLGVTDEAGNTLWSDAQNFTVSDVTSPDAPAELSSAIDRLDITLSWKEALDNVGVAGYEVRYGMTENLEGEVVYTQEASLKLSDIDYGVWYYQVRSVDAAGNVSDWSGTAGFTFLPPPPEGFAGDSNGVSWNEVPHVAGYVVEYSLDNFETILKVETAGSALSTLSLPQGTYQWRVRPVEITEWSSGNEITAEDSLKSEVLEAAEDGNTDVFFASGVTRWEVGYSALHDGTLNGWEGTKEKVVLTGKNRITDVFIGSADANVLLMTDDANGDALFVEDIYSAFPDDDKQARLSQIDEIRAGAGDDIVDLTGRHFVCKGSGLTIHGGLGDDTIWAGHSSNTLYGDAGNDRIVGGTGDDAIIGGEGDDAMHGGGGNDTFFFGDDFGNDTVEQLDDGTVTLHFESENGSWNEETRVYTSGYNSVTVIGNAQVNIVFGESAVAGAFDDSSSEKIFEEKALLA